SSVALLFTLSLHDALPISSIGNFAFTKLMKIGILEQLQNGVIVPSKAPSIAPFTPFSLLNICFVFSGVNLLSIYENIKIRTHNRIIIFIKSYKIGRAHV